MGRNTKVPHSPPSLLQTKASCESVRFSNQQVPLFCYTKKNKEGALVKKLYISPEFEKLKIDLNTVICSSLNAETPETPMDDIIEIDNGDDV